MAKIILNKGYGGFDVSTRAYKTYAERIGKELFYYIGNYEYEEHHIVYKKVSYEDFLSRKTLFYFYSTQDLGEVITKDIVREECDSELYLNEGHREDPLLIQIVEELGEEASGWAGTLKVVEIPDELANGNYMVDDYDGWENLHAKVEEY